jgi:hypothetical protein
MPILASLSIYIAPRPLSLRPMFGLVSQDEKALQAGSAKCVIASISPGDPTKGILCDVILCDSYTLLRPNKRENRTVSGL